MSKIHVLAGNGGTYNLIIHTNTPAGINTVANSWKACIIAAGIAKTSSMDVGTGVGQITSSEAASILAGDVLEFSASIANNADGAAPSSGQLTTFADNYITNKFNELQVALKFYGYTQ